MKLIVRNNNSPVLEKEIYTVHIHNTIDDNMVSYLHHSNCKFEKYKNPVFNRILYSCKIVSTNNIGKSYTDYSLYTPPKYKVLK